MNESFSISCKLKTFGRTKSPKEPLLTNFFYSQNSSTGTLKTTTDDSATLARIELKLDKILSNSIEDDLIKDFPEQFYVLKISQETLYLYSSKPIEEKTYFELVIAIDYEKTQFISLPVVVDALVAQNAYKCTIENSHAKRRDSLIAFLFYLQRANI